LENGNSKTLTALLDGKNTFVELGSDALSYKVNLGQTGFYRVNYLDKSNLLELGKQVAHKVLATEDRWGLQNDLYALVKSCDVSIGEYLVVLSNYADEDAFLPLISIAGNLFHAYLVMDGRRREEIASVGKSILEKVLSAIGYEPGRGEKHATSLLRDQIIWPAVLYGSEEVLEFAMERFSSLARGEKIHPDIIKSVMQVGALTGSNEAFEWFEKRLQSSESEHERMNILVALGSFKDRALTEKAQQFVLDNVPARNRFIPIGHMAANPYAIPSMWEWYLSHIEELEQFHPVHYERVIEAIIPLCGLGKEERVKIFFKDYIRKKEKAKDVIKLSLEKLDVNSRMRKISASPGERVVC